MSATPSLECDCEFAPNIFIKKRRIHQVFGPSRIRMLLFLAKKISGPIFWIKSPDEKIFLHPDGIYPWMNSSRITFIYTDSQYDKLWAIENIIKDRSSDLIAANFNTTPAFNSIRRLNLGIKNYNSSANQPICIFFTDSAASITGVESRWFVKNEPSWHNSIGQNLNVNTEKWLFKREYCKRNPNSKWIVTLKKNLYEDTQKKYTLQSIKLT